MAVSPRARMFVIPLIALSVTLVSLAVAIGVVLGVRSRESCVVGTWRVTAHREEATVDGVGAVTFTGTGARVRLRADGTGETDYGTGTRFEGAAGGQTLRLDVSGRLTYRYTAADETFSVRDMESAATGTVFVNGREYAETRFDGRTDPARYTCSDDTMTMETDDYETSLTLVG